MGIIPSSHLLLCFPFQTLSALKRVLRAVADIHLASWEVIGEGGDAWSGCLTLPDSTGWGMGRGTGEPFGSSRTQERHCSKEAAANKCELANISFTLAVRDVEDALALAQHELFAGTERI